MSNYIKSSYVYLYASWQPYPMTYVAIKLGTLPHLFSSLQDSRYHSRRDGVRWASRFAKMLYAVQRKGWCMFLHNGHAAYEPKLTPTSVPSLIRKIVTGFAGRRQGWNSPVKIFYGYTYTDGKPFCYELRKCVDLEIKNRPSFCHLTSIHQFTYVNF